MEYKNIPNDPQDSRIRWSVLKRFIGSTSFNNLFFATFATLVSIIATNVLPSIGSIKIVSNAINYHHIIFCMFLFFVCAVIWYIALIVYQIFIPIEVISHDSDFAYVEKGIASPLYGSTAEKAKIGLDLVENWHEIDNTKPIPRLLIIVFGVLASVGYLLTLCFFLLSLGESLFQIYQLVQPQPSPCLAHQ